MGFSILRGTEVCGSQLLHLDSKKRPLWLNSSLRKNKHNQGSREFATLTHWMAGGYNISEQIGWDYGKEQGVDWCAHGGDVVEMSPEETRVVDNMIGVSSRVDILLLTPSPEKLEKEKKEKEEKEKKEKEEKEKKEKEEKEKKENEEKEKKEKEEKEKEEEEKEEKEKKEKDSSDRTY